MFIGEGGMGMGTGNTMNNYDVGIHLATISPTVPEVHIITNHIVKSCYVLLLL